MIRPIIYSFVSFGLGFCIAALMFPHRKWTAPENTVVVSEGNRILIEKMGELGDADGLTISCVDEHGKVLAYRNLLRIEVEPEDKDAASEEE